MVMSKQIMLKVTSDFTERRLGDGGICMDKAQTHILLL